MVKKSKKDLSFITKILHHPFLKEDAHGSLHMPVYENVAFEFKTAEDSELAFQRKKPAHMYSRVSNPTVEAFEQQVRAVTDSIGVVALSSGMAAIANVLFAAASQGENIITSRNLFGNTYSLFSTTFKDWGLDVRFANLTDTNDIKRLIDGKTRAIFFETVTNPQLEIVDIEAIAKLAKPKNILVIADTTLTPPYVFRSKDFGVDVEVLSSTKYISGGATSVGGLIIDNGLFNWGKIPKFKDEYKQLGPHTLINHLRRKVYRNLGACMSPHVAFLQSMGLETLPFRIDVSNDNALKIAQFLQKETKVQSVSYPALKNSRFYKIGQKQFGGKVGAVLTFELKSKEQCFKFMNHLKIIRRATNLNDNRTLALHPASTIFVEYDLALKKRLGVPETMVRLAVGIEDPDDLINDIKQALRSI